MAAANFGPRRVSLDCFGLPPEHRSPDPETTHDRRGQSVCTAREFDLKSRLVLAVGVPCVGLQHAAGFERQAPDFAGVVFPFELAA